MISPPLARDGRKCLGRLRVPSLPLVLPLPRIDRGKRVPTAENIERHSSRTLSRFALLAAFSSAGFYAELSRFRQNHFVLEAATQPESSRVQRYYSLKNPPPASPRDDSYSLLACTYPLRTCLRSHAFSAPGLACSVLFPPLLPGRTHVPRNRVSSACSYLVGVVARVRAAATPSRISAPLLGEACERYR